MSRILVIGAKGMLGRDLVPELHSSFPCDDILAWDIEEVDIRKQQETIEQIEGVCPTVVINLAGYTDVDGSESHEEEAFEVNAEGMKHIVMGAKRCGAKTIYLSTDYVFDGRKGAPYLEEDPPNPLNTYGRSKRRGEEFVLELAEDGLIIRTQWLYGRHGKSFVTAILRQAREKEVLSIVDDQVGAPTYTVDLSKAISQLIRKQARGIFHVTNSGFCSWYDFGQTILRLSGMEKIKVLPVSSQDLNRKARRPAYSVLSTQKLKQETGIELRPWPEAIKEFLSLCPGSEKLI